MARTPHIRGAAVWRPVAPRLGLVLLLGAQLSAPCAPAEAQQAGKVPRIGVLATSSFMLARFGAFRDGLRDLGYVEGTSIVLEYRRAEGKLDRLPDLAVELVRAKVDLIVTASTEGVLAAKKASTTIPIVFGAVQDPLASGLVESLARPGGNATGLSAVAPELSAKRVELLKATVPGIARVAFLWTPGPGAAVNLRETRATARALGMQQPTKFEFTVNLKAARQIGLTIPPAVLARADRIIE